jgi:carboxylesterase 2
MGQQISSLLWGPAWKPSRQIRIENGLIQGKTFEINDQLSVDAFLGESRLSNFIQLILGIPFARPPIGPLRFKKPEPAENWEGIRDCTKFGPRCPHEDVSIEKLTVFYPKSEDCLVLNVFTPITESNADQDLLPVAVFIHGGAFAVHSSAHYGDFGICKNLCSKGIIVVTVQYRLGFFGFLSTGDANCPGNFGLWDQTMALRWVQRNIKSFHGDPDNVTLFGQSAGGASTDYLSLSPHSRGWLMLNVSNLQILDLFKRMVPMSGTSHCSFAINDSEHIRELSLKFALRHGFILSSTQDKNAQNAALVEFFRTLPASVFELNMLGINNDGKVDLSPVWDGDFFPEPIEILQKTAPLKKTMTGITQHEALLFCMLIFGRMWMKSLTSSF